MSRENKDLIVGLDIGTSKVVAVVAEVNDEGRLNVLALASQESKGLKKGVVVNIEETVGTISRVIQDIELMADCKVKDVYTGIAGSHIRSFNSTGMVAIKDKEVTSADIDRVIETARAMPIPTDQQTLHILTQEFVIDGQDGIREPIGMSGFKLEVSVHIVTGSVAAVQNLIKSVRRCGLEVSDLVLQPLASSYATLLDDEKDLGVCLVDIGGGTTDLAVFTQGAIRHTAVIPIAGDLITNDIAMALRTPTQHAEEIKINFGCAMNQLAAAEDSIEVAGVGDRPPRKLSQRALADVIQPRIEELYQLIQDELRRSGFENLLSSGIVITGGAAQMPGMIELGEEIFHMPVRLGVPRYKGSLDDMLDNPRYSTVFGLLLEAQAQKKRGQKVADTQDFKQVLNRMKSWFERNF
ncbi:MAG TPA: cell division protein FtsA [Rhodocyclaceae bacterium]|nr:cell division protein FtsA [Rhodocyclaceae bacterium]